MFWSIFFGFISGIIIQILIRLFDEKYLHPIREFHLVRRKIVSAFTMYKPQYRNPAYIPLEGFSNAPYHHDASSTLRGLASELVGVVASFYIADTSLKGLRGFIERIRKCETLWLYRHLPEQIALEDAQKYLIEISNSLFLPAGVKIDEDEQGEHNEEISQKVKNLLYSQRGKG